MIASHRPIASVVIPCYNQARFLPDAIESALQQTFPAVEVIVVNDGSTDDTAAVARKYQTVRLLDQRNHGTAVARNAGLRDSRGEYVVFVDADDRLLPHAIATGIESLRAHPDWAFVTGHIQLIRQDGSSAGIPSQSHRDGDPYLALLRSNYIWTPGAIVYRRSVLETVGGFETFAGGSADYELNIRIARRFPFGCHHQVVLEYRQHGNNMSADRAYMLKSAVTARRAQRKYVRRDEAAEEAWKAGIGHVKVHYGRRVVAQVKADLLGGRRSRAFRGMLRLLQYYPAGVIQVVSAGVTRVLTLRR